MENTGPPAQPTFAPWQQPTDPPRSRRGLWATIITVVLVLACLGGAGLVGRQIMRSTSTPVARGLAGDLKPGQSAPASSPEDEEDTVTGPQPSSYPVREAQDLEKVCDQRYYPQSPKVGSSGIQPVSIFGNDRKDVPYRIEKTLYDIPNWSSAKRKKAWDPKSPAQVRLVACVDLVSTGKKIRTCKFDDPKPDKIPLREGTYRLALYEVATGKKLLDKKVKGQDDECPFLVLLGADRTTYSQVEDRQLYELLKKYVEK